MEVWALPREQEEGATSPLVAAEAGGKEWGAGAPTSLSIHTPACGLYNADGLQSPSAPYPCDGAWPSAMHVVTT